MNAARKHDVQRDRTSSQGCDVTTSHEPPILLVSIAGEIDASNADILDVAALTEPIQPGVGLVLDMTKVDFLGVQGLRNLFDLADECKRRGVPWALAASHAVHRMLRVGDPQSRLPAARSVAQALQGFDMDNPSPARDRLRLVTPAD
jgi:anti-anti-sigma factor